jgi:hypothetical protein
MSVDNDDFKLGQTVGDAVATVTGTAEALFGGGEAVEPRQARSLAFVPLSQRQVRPSQCMALQPPR